VLKKSCKKDIVSVFSKVKNISKKAINKTKSKIQDSCMKHFKRSSDCRKKAKSSKDQN